MKFTLALFVVLAIIGLGKAHQFPDFGKGPLHEDIQDFLDLIPYAKVLELVIDYIENDAEVQEWFELVFSENGPLVKAIMDIEDIPEFRNVCKYLEKADLEVYDLLNELHKYLGIDKEIKPRSVSGVLQRTGGLAGMYEDLKNLFDYAAVIRTYAKKLKTSSAFSAFLSECKSNNFQEMVNKIYAIPAYRTLLDEFHKRNVNTQVGADLGYILLGITTPLDPDFLYAERTIKNKLQHFGNLFQERYLFQ